jgi:hypothetical protein
MSYTDHINPVPFDDTAFPFIDDDFDWDAFLNFDPESLDPSLSLEDDSSTQWKQLDSAHQDQPPLVAPIAGLGSPKDLATEDSSPAMGNPSTSNQLTTTSNFIEQSQTKRGIQDFLSSFSVDGTLEPLPRKRQAFSPSRRTEVAKVRKIRACQRCKMRKLTASRYFNLPLRSRVTR